MKLRCLCALALTLALLCGAFAEQMQELPPDEKMEPAVVNDLGELDGIPQTAAPLGLPECAPVADSYFDDAVFIGDSVTLKLNYYVRDARKDNPSLLGGAQFLTAGSMGSGNAMEKVGKNSIHPSYRGKKMSLEDAVAKMGAKKVFIMLGMNDVAVYGAEQSAQNLIELITRIRAKSPDTVFFVESATPRLKGTYKTLTNDLLFRYDMELYRLVKEYETQGVYFVDVAYVMRNEEGDLPAPYCSDPDDLALHFTDEACKIWVDYLYTHALTAQ